MNGPKVGETIWYLSSKTATYPATVRRIVRPVDSDYAPSEPFVVAQNQAGRLVTVHLADMFWNGQCWEEGVKYA